MASKSLSLLIVAFALPWLEARVPVSMHDQQTMMVDDSHVSFMTMDDHGNIIDIFGRE